MLRSRSSSSIIDIHFLLSARPLSWRNRLTLVNLLSSDSEIEDWAESMELTPQKLRSRVEERISYSCFPSNIKSTEIESTSTLPFEAPVDDSISTSLHLESSFLSSIPEKNTLLVCYIRRIKSTLQTTYTLYLEEISSESTMTSSPGKINLNKPLLSAKRQHGLTFSCTISSLLGMSTMKDSITIGKIIKSGQVYSFTGITEYPGRVKVAIRYMTMDRLFNVICAAEVVQDAEVDDAVLQGALEAISTSQSVLLPSGVFGLRTRPPRRASVSIKDPKSSNTYQVSFGGLGRSRKPSKKNIVLEIADGR
jgi:hypothetical protein